jgi:hypothetical protein
VANQMIFEINLMAGKMLILQHQIIEVMKISPRHIVENLNVDYKEKIREKKRPINGKFICFIVAGRLALLRLTFQIPVNRPVVLAELSKILTPFWETHCKP